MFIIGLILAVLGGIGLWVELMSPLICVAAIVVGICFIISGILNMADADEDWYLPIWLIGIVVYGIYFFIVGTSSKFKIICLIAVIVILLVLTLVLIFKVKGRIEDFQDSIKEAMSAVKIAKHKYLVAVEKGTTGFGSAVADNLEKAQLKLNREISEYNKFIRFFPTSIVAKIFRYKKITLIDEASLDGSKDLNGYDDSAI